MALGLWHQEETPNKYASHISSKDEIRLSSKANFTGVGQLLHSEVV